MGAHLATLPLIHFKKYILWHLWFWLTFYLGIWYWIILGIGKIATYSGVFHFPTLSYVTSGVNKNSANTIDRITHQCGIHSSRKLNPSFFISHIFFCTSFSKKNSENNTKQTQNNSAINLANNQPTDIHLWGGLETQEKLKWRNTRNSMWIWFLEFDDSPEVLFS